MQQDDSKNITENLHFIVGVSAMLLMIIQLVVGVIIRRKLMQTNVFKNIRLFTNAHKVADLYLKYLIC